MRTLAPIAENEDSREFVEKFIEKVPAFADFVGIDAVVDAPVFVWENGEAVDLSEPGLHLVDGEWIAPDATIMDQEYEQWVLVSGDMRCKELHTAGWFFVNGHLEAEIVSGRSGCNNMLSAGSARIGTLLERGHSIGIVGELSFDVIFSEHGMVTSEGESTEYPEQWATDVFVDELIVDEDVDWDVWREWVDAGRRWYR